jgi:hypothetical protein
MGLFYVSPEHMGLFCATLNKQTTALTPHRNPDVSRHKAVFLYEGATFIVYYLIRLEILTILT